MQAVGSLQLSEERVDAAIDLFERAEFTRGQVQTCFHFLEQEIVCGAVMAVS